MIVQQFFTVVWGDNYYPYPGFIKKATLPPGKLVVSKSYLIMLSISAIVLLFSVGINMDYIISATFAIAGILAGITGYFLGITYTVDTFTGSLILKGIVASIIGSLEK